MKKALILVADPETSSTVFGDGIHVSVRHGADAYKPAILEVGSPAKRGDPNSPTLILKEGLHKIIRQSTASLAVNRNFAVLPSVQARTRSKPNAAISGRQYVPNVGISQTLLDRNRGDREIAK